MVGIGNISILNVLYNYKTVSIIHCIYLNIYFEQMGLCRFIFYVEIKCTNVYLHYINQPLAWKYIFGSRLKKGNFDIKWIFFSSSINIIYDVCDSKMK